MKQTAIQISMINNNINNSINNNDEQRMTSLEIAQLTGKQHKNVMRDIRNMEPAWEKTTGLKFELGSYEDLNGQSRPCYFLTKTECIFVATRFNDEARAKLVLRWKELEREVRCKTDDVRARQQRPQEIRLLACDEEVLNEADEIIGDELDELNCLSDHCYTPTDIGKPFGLDGRDLNSFLADSHIIYKSCGEWKLARKYQHMDLTDYFFKYTHDRNGRRKLVKSLVWTEEGRQFLLDMIYGRK